MGSSYRSDLNSGRMPEWEKPLRAAVAEIERIASEAREIAGDDGQFDNAADDGALANALGNAARIIKAELPMLPAEREGRIQRLRRELAYLESIAPTDIGEAQP